MSTQKFQAVRGMNDILPDQSGAWAFLEATLRRWLAQYGYSEVRSPVLEPTGLFIRSIGEVTDIVEKEMYTFVDSLNGESLTLRPEATASCVRLAVQHNLLYAGPQRLWYMGPMFRHERPQKGRYRQFHQCGAEALGFAGPDADAELILMTARLWEMLGLKEVSLEINTIGSLECRQQHRRKLVEYFQRHQELLDEDSRRRLHTNPLRILDSKNPALSELIDGAPRLMDALDAESAAHFESLQTLLRAAGLQYRINPRLVRGLDYYNATVFEWVTPLLGAQSTICGGGRYDGLVEQLGGKPTPACGFAMGLERLLAVLQETRAEPFPESCPDVYVVHQGETAQQAAFLAADAVRAAGFSAVLHCGGGSFKSQLKRADASRAAYAMILGEDEVRAGLVSLKPLRGQGDQQTVPLAQAMQLLKT
ncbi:MAG: histidine--tRNA ligase [Betaproteobacteria bacterium]|nr:histidine--tRNA ligase [Betaproteobacteria bacterium]